MKYVEREIQGSRTIVVFKYGALYYYLMWPTLVISVLAGSTADSPHYVIIAACCWVILVGLAVPMWSTLREVKQAMKNGGVKVSGSKWSFANPLRYEWETNSKP